MFASIREEAGRSSLSLSIDSGCSVSEVLELVQKETGARLDKNRRYAVAVNNEYTDGSRLLSDGDEIAIIPPVSGGCVLSTVNISADPLVPQEYLKTISGTEYGAVVTFMGVTRSNNAGRNVHFLEYEAYKPMAEAKIAELIEEMAARWNIGKVAVGHRIGRVMPGEVSMVLVVGAPHRRDAFEAASYFVDRLKQVVPIWKKEHFEDGSVWVADNTGG